jgi:hypothetical protein
LATNTPILGLKKPVPNVEENWAFRLNESLDILDQSLLVGNASSKENVTTFNDGVGHLVISGSTNPVFDHVEAITFNSDFITVATGTFTDILGVQVITTSGIFDEVILNGVSLTTQTPVDNSFKLLFAASDRKSTTTDGGTFTAGDWRVRTINSVDSNLLPGASLASNTITLSEPGDYYVEWSTPGYKVNRHKSILYNITDAHTQFVGSNEYSSSGGNVQTISVGGGKFNIDKPTDFQIWHRCEFTHATFGLGVDSNFGEAEIYTQIRIWPQNPSIASFDTVLAASGTFDEGLTVSGVPVNIGAGSGDTLQNSYDNGTGIITTVSGKPFVVSGTENDEDFDFKVVGSGIFTEGLQIGTGSTHINQHSIVTATGIFSGDEDNLVVIGDDEDSFNRVLIVQGRMRATRGLAIGRGTVVIEDDYITASGITTVTGCFTEAVFIGDPESPTVISGSDSGAASFEAVETGLLHAFEAQVDDRIHVGVSGAGPTSLLGISVLETLNVIASGSVQSPVGIFPDTLNIPSFATDPTAADGDVWINTTISGIRWQQNGSIFEVQGTEVA